LDCVPRPCQLSNWEGLGYTTNTSFFYPEGSVIAPQKKRVGEMCETTQWWGRRVVVKGKNEGGQGRWLGQITTQQE